MFSLGTGTKYSLLISSGLVGSPSSGLAAQAAGAAKPLEGLPTKPLLINNEYFVPVPNENIRRIAEDYMRSTGRPYYPPQTYAQVNVPRAERIAQAFEDMPHAPDDPRVRASYEAIANETLA